MVEGDGAEFTCVYDGQATTITLFLSDIQIESDNYRLRGMQDSNGNMLRSNQLRNPRGLALHHWTCHSQYIQPYKLFDTPDSPHGIYSYDIVWNT